MIVIPANAGVPLGLAGALHLSKARLSPGRRDGTEFGYDGTVTPVSPAPMIG
jgi:hypothetical protein